ncbi:hypothetical protein [Mycolicibacterium smegmatis]|nr:hypothetical protein [Mycolicibacterium smegmatis]
MAGKIAANNRKTTIVQARSDLPPGSVIMPDPDPDENPDAWV